MTQKDDTARPDEVIAWKDLEKAFYAHRTVFFTGEVTEQLCSNVARRLMGLQHMSMEPITLVIDSGGGDMHDALKLCDVIGTFIRAPVRGVAIGTCGSAATFVMLSCTERLGTPNVRFLIHSARRDSIAVPVNGTTPAHLEQLLRETSATERAIEKLYADKLTPRQRGRRPMTPAQKLAFVRGLIARGDQAFDKYLSVEEAIAAGIITGLFNGKLDIMPKV